MWNYSKKVQDYFVHPHNAGPLADANAIGEVGSIACGDALKLYLKINDQGVIEKASFETFGCASAIASSSVLTDMVIGMKVDDALKITNADIAKALDGLPREKMHCSVMGQEALEAAIRQWKGEPAMPRTQEEGKLVCKCFNVTDQTIIRAIRENHLKTVDDVTAFTKAGGGCGECRDEIAEILEAELKREGETIEQPVKKPAEEKPAGLSNLQRMQKVMEVINMIRPQLQADGGDIELVDINGKVVSVRLQGSCHGCAASQVTLHQVIEQILRQQVEPDIVIEEAQK
ncbi:MAG: Fe-S cluster assembly protein NifU [Desulfovibrio sp.]|jgi:NifU-like protein|nr:Fe-S cluster assembly protein NifU [Desulfovibrio sp.]MDD7477769.1 Fe-S cluster assembly protein NifU [Desulfovibrio sp.]MDY5486762.1 Fe-S cluster assembly protein NifU [Desulfovibrio sp.]MEE0406198.1 Fe-S cluster assembly protein NifU [Desulfovibrio sp.]HAK22151.1 Fe-S cluster assembly protein NifU [Desulfovibrio sp.]